MAYSLLGRFVTFILASSLLTNATPVLNSRATRAGQGTSFGNFTTFNVQSPQPVGGPVAIDPQNKGEFIRVSFMNDGALIGGYVKSEGNQAVLKAVRSTDHGQSWQLIGEVFRGDIATHDMNNAFPMQLPSGRVLYAYRNHDRTGSDLHYTWFRISISYSDDGGRTYKYLSTVDERAPVPGTASGLWEPYLRIARDGSIQCYYSSENNKDDQDNLMRVSRDGGLTWSAPITVSGVDVLSRDGMTGVAPINNDGSLM
jgi:BNR repeat-like domain